MTTTKRGAVWVQTTPTTMILMGCATDGYAVLATVDRKWNWQLADGSARGSAGSRYAAQRQIRKALRERAEG